jgi:hypothetical protein
MAVIDGERMSWIFRGFIEGRLYLVLPVAGWLIMMIVMLRKCY